MLDPSSGSADLPAIPGKRYFTIGEVSDLCQVKPHVLRYWEQEFPQLKPVKRRGNRRYYQRHDVLMIRQIRNVNVTLGLPFVRTSPDHGTAFDIAGQGGADPASLLAAVATRRLEGQCTAPS